MSSKSARVAIPVALVIVAAGLWWQRGAQAQTPSENDVRWEFATVEALQELWQGNVKISTANICYHTTNGCRWDTIRVSVNRWGQMHDALAAATARLGERGWEAVSATSPNDTHLPTILLKRVRPAEAAQ